MEEITIADVYYSTSFIEWKSPSKIYVDMLMDKKFLKKQEVEIPLLQNVAVPINVYTCLWELWSDLGVLESRDAMVKIKEELAIKYYPKLNYKEFRRKPGAVWVPHHAEEGELENRIQHFSQ